MPQISRLETVADDVVAPGWFVDPVSERVRHDATSNGVIINSLAVLHEEVTDVAFDEHKRTAADTPVSKPRQPLHLPPTTWTPSVVGWATPTGPTPRSTSTRWSRG